MSKVQAQASRQPYLEYAQVVIEVEDLRANPATMQAVISDGTTSLAPLVRGEEGAKYQHLVMDLDQASAIADALHELSKADRFFADRLQGGRRLEESRQGGLADARRAHIAGLSYIIRPLLDKIPGGTSP